MIDISPTKTDAGTATASPKVPTRSNFFEILGSGDKWDHKSVDDEAHKRTF
jgi:hypothetical protein